MGIRVLIAVPQDIPRIGLHTIFAEDPRVSSVYEVATIEELSEHLGRFQVDFIVIHQSLNIDFESLAKYHFVILATEPDINILRQAYAYGADGYLLENVSADLLKQTIAVSEKCLLLDPGLASWIIRHLSDNTPQSIPDEILTPREREIFDLRQSGLSNHEIAQQLDIAETTVKTHMAHISRKLNRKRLS